MNTNHKRERESERGRGREREREREGESKSQRETQEHTYIFIKHECVLLRTSLFNEHSPPEGSLLSTDQLYTMNNTMNKAINIRQR